MCRECRRYVRPASGEVAGQIPAIARESEHLAGMELVASVLTPNRGKGAKLVRSLASMPLGRCGASGCEAQGAVDF